VHWKNLGIHIVQMHEAYAGMESSNEPPCSGFVVVGDDGVPCAGFRQCHSQKGVRGGHEWDVPLELRCATNAALTEWTGPIWLYNVSFYRALPYDPVRPWVDADGKVHYTHSLYTPYALTMLCGLIFVCSGIQQYRRMDATRALLFSRQSLLLLVLEAMPELTSVLVPESRHAPRGGD
jgi:hypothetical protein